MNLFTDTGEGLLCANGEPLQLDGYPLTPVSRAQESFDLLLYRWNNRPQEGLKYTQGNYVLTLEQEPELITKDGEAIGVEVHVSLTENGQPVAIDGHRRIINPPLMRRDDIEVGMQFPGLAFGQALLDSILAVPE